MKTTPSLALTLLAVALVAPAAATAQTSAQTGRDPARLFPMRATVSATHGLTRAPLSAAVLSHPRADLSDVRLYDAEGQEVPYLVDSGQDPSPVPHSFSVDPLDVSRSLEGREPVSSRERFVLLLPPSEQTRRLQLVSRVPRFVRDVVVREGDREVYRGRFFRLPAPLRERVAIDLPGLSSGSVEISVELEGEGGYLEPSFRVETTRERRETLELTVPLEEVSRRAEDGRTVIEVRGPSGVYPRRLTFRTGTAAFARDVTVSALRPGEPAQVVARGLVWRMPELAADEVVVDLPDPRAERLRIAIEDGDSPALEGLVVEATVPEPALLFHGDGAPMTLYFGGGRTRAPRYDLSRLASRFAAVVEASPPRAAQLTAIEPNPAFVDGPALDFAMTPGRAVDAAAFSHVARLTVSGAEEGLSVVTLPPSVLAPARPDAGDLRVVDAEGRQRAYLWGAERGRAFDVEVGAPTAEAPGSRYAIELPAERATLRGLALEVDADYVARPYELWGIDDAGRWVELDRGALTRDPTEARAPLRLAAAPRRVSALELRVADGDDAPLAIVGAEVTVVDRPLFLAAPDGEYRVLVGEPGTGAPTYEIERARALVLEVRAAEAEAEGATTNPAHVEPAWYEGAAWSTYAVWGVLLLAMLVLGLLTLRVARAPEDSEEPGSGEPGSDEDPPPPPSSPDPPAEGGGSEPLAF